MGYMTQSGAITVSQAARILDESRWTVVRRIKAGELLAEKLGDATAPWLLNLADVERFKANRAADAVRKALAS